MNEHDKHLVQRCKTFLALTDEDSYTQLMHVEIQQALLDLESRGDANVVLKAKNIIAEDVLTMQTEFRYMVGQVLYRTLNLDQGIISNELDITRLASYLEVDVDNPNKAIAPYVRAYNAIAETEPKNDHEKLYLNLTISLHLVAKHLLEIVSRDTSQQE